MVINFSDNTIFNSGKDTWIIDNNEPLLLFNYPTKGVWEYQLTGVKPLSETSPTHAFFLSFSHVYSLFYHNIPIILGEPEVPMWFNTLMRLPIKFTLKVPVVAALL